MIKVNVLFRFRADRDPEEVRTWWMNDHGKIALRNLGMFRTCKPLVGAIERTTRGGLGYDGGGGVVQGSRDLPADDGEPEWEALEDDGPNGLDMTSLMGGS